MALRPVDERLGAGREGEGQDEQRGEQREQGATVLDRRCIPSLGFEVTALTLPGSVHDLELVLGGRRVGVPSRIGRPDLEHVLTVVEALECLRRVAHDGHFLRSSLHSKVEFGSEDFNSNLSLVFSVFFGAPPMILVFGGALSLRPSTAMPKKPPRLPSSAIKARPLRAVEVGAADRARVFAVRPVDVAVVDRHAPWCTWRRRRGGDEALVDVRAVEVGAADRAVSARRARVIQ